MKITYQSDAYAPQKITGHFVRCQGRKGSFTFKNMETCGKAGEGPSLREYETDGSELPEEFRALCINSKSTERLK